MSIDYQETIDEASFAYSQAEYDRAISLLGGVLEADPVHFEAELALSMAYYRKGDLARAIIEGQKAAELRPKEQLVHTNLSLFYMKSGDKERAEHHGLQARIAAWKSGGSGTEPEAGHTELELAKPKPPPPQNFPDMPWKKKPKVAGGEAPP